MFLSQELLFPRPLGEGFKNLLQETIEPRERALQRIHPVLWLAQPMTFTRITHQHSFYAAAAERHVHFFGLRDVYVVVLLAVNEKRGRLGLPRIAQRRPLPEQIIVVPRKAAKLNVNQVLIQRSRIEADQVADAGGGHGGPEAGGLRNAPIGHEAAITAADHAQATR